VERRKHGEDQNQISLAVERKTSENDSGSGHRDDKVIDEGEFSRNLVDVQRPTLMEIFEMIDLYTHQDITGVTVGDRVPA